MTTDAPWQNEAGSVEFGRRQLLFGGLLGGAALAAQAFVPRRKLDLLGSKKLEKLIPSQIGPWSFLSSSGLIVPPPDELAAAIYAQTVTRLYVAKDRLPIMLVIAQSPAQDGVVQVHRPEICYPASGYSLSGNAIHNVPLGRGVYLPTRRFSATGADRIEQLVYWTRIGYDLPTSWAAQRLAVAKANFRGMIPDGLLVRISTVAPDTSALAVIDEFARFLIGALPPADRAILIGSAISEVR